MMKLSSLQKISLVFISFLLTILSSHTLAQTWDIQIEGGGVWQYRNDLQIPPTSAGSRIALDQVDSGPFPYYRIEAFWRFSKNHGARLLYAPFEISLKGTPTQATLFNGQTFSANQEIEYTYKFNSYRLTYFYAFWGHGDDQLNLGFTAKIRDADTVLKQGRLRTNYDNVGFVPLLYLEYQKSLSANWLFHTSLDGLAGGPGRAFDLSLKLRRKLGKSSLVGLGTRFLEGGADNEKVYSFSLFQYLAFELIFSF